MALKWVGSIGNKILSNFGGFQRRFSPCHGVIAISFFPSAQEESGVFLALFFCYFITVAGFFDPVLFVLENASLCFFIYILAGSRILLLLPSLLSID